MALMRLENVCRAIKKNYTSQIDNCRQFTELLGSHEACQVTVHHTKHTAYATRDCCMNGVQATVFSSPFCLYLATLSNNSAQQVIGLHVGHVRTKPANGHRARVLLEGRIRHTASNVKTEDRQMDGYI